MKDKLVKTAFLDALGTTAYIVLVASFMYYGSHGFFGKNDSVILPITMLMLLVFSASLTGLLMFGKPAMMYLDGKKKEELALIGYTLAFFSALTLIALLLLTTIFSR